MNIFFNYAICKISKGMRKQSQNSSSTLMSMCCNSWNSVINCVICVRKCFALFQSLYGKMKFLKNILIAFCNLYVIHDFSLMYILKMFSSRWIFKLISWPFFSFSFYNFWSLVKTQVIKIELRKYTTLKKKNTLKLNNTDFSK